MREVIYFLDKDESARNRKRFMAGSSRQAKSPQNKVIFLLCFITVADIIFKIIKWGPG